MINKLNCFLKKKEWNGVNSVTWSPLKFLEMVAFLNCTWCTADMASDAARRRHPMTPTTAANTLRCQAETAPPLAACCFPCWWCRSLPMLVALTLPAAAAAEETPPSISTLDHGSIARPHGKGRLAVEGNSQLDEVFLDSRQQSRARQPPAPVWEGRS